MADRPSFDSSAGFVAITCRFSGTLFPRVLQRWTFRIYLCLCLCIHISYRYGYFKDFDHSSRWYALSWHNIEVVYGIATFLSTLFIDECYHRYLHIFKLTRTVLVHLVEVTQEINSMIGVVSRAHAMMACRLFTAAIDIFFCELVCGSHSEEGWSQMEVRGLLLKEEVIYLRSFKYHARHLALLAWSMEACKRGFHLASGRNRIPANMMKFTTRKMLRVRQMKQEIIDSVSMPLPQPYRFMTHAIVLIGMALCGFRMALCDSFLPPLIYTCTLIFFLAVLELGDLLADPYTNDDLGFSVGPWLQDFRSRSEFLMKYSYLTFLGPDDKDYLEDEPNPAACCVM